MVKFVIVSTHGQDDLERASIAWATANAAIALDAEVFIFLQCEAVNVVRKDFCKGWVFPPFTSIEELIKNFIEFGGRVFACVPCVEARRIDNTSFIDGVEVAGATTLLTESADAVQTLIY
ncbi:MAG: DsrE family protein [Candidatus Thorarchaeota archaeon]